MNYPQLSAIRNARSSHDAIELVREKDWPGHPADATRTFRSGAHSAVSARRGSLLTIFAGSARHRASDCESAPDSVSIRKAAVCGRYMKRTAERASSSSVIRSSWRVMYVRKSRSGMDLAPRRRLRATVRSSMLAACRGALEGRIDCGRVVLRRDRSGAAMRASRTQRL